MLLKIFGIYLLLFHFSCRDREYNASRYYHLTTILEYLLTRRYS